MFNADGSEGRMCGNAIRCVALWMELYDGFRGKSIEVETLSGIKTISYTEWERERSLSLCRWAEQGLNVRRSRWILRKSSALM